MLIVLSCRSTSLYRVDTTNLPDGYGMISVALPASYGSDTTALYPTLYLLNGHGGDHTSWGKIVDLDSLATAYDIIIVCPAGLNSWYFDAPAQPDLRMESYITRDLTAWVDSAFTTYGDAAHRAITGLSMGGHGGLWLAMRHPDLFGLAGSTSGGVDFTPWPRSWNIADRLGAYDADPELWRTHTVMYEAQSLEPGTLKIIFDCGTEDFFFEVNNRLDSLLTQRGIEHTYLTSPGAHNGAYWSRSILPQLDFFSSIWSK